MKPDSGKTDKPGWSDVGLRNQKDGGIFFETLQILIKNLRILQANHSEMPFICIQTFVFLQRMGKHAIINRPGEYIPVDKRDFFARPSRGRLV